MVYTPFMPKNLPKLEAYESYKILKNISNCTSVVTVYQQTSPVLRPFASQANLNIRVETGEWLEGGMMEWIKVGNILSIL